MKVAMIGLGKLGLPVALAMGGAHDVTGFDVLERRMTEAEGAGLKVADINAACLGAEIVFIAVQTPHDPRFEGVTRLTDERRDFDYTFLKFACRAVREATVEGQIVVVMSTVLPGTMEREICPLLTGRRIGYNPAFIAMGAVEYDFLHPEFVLLGSDDELARQTIERFYRELFGDRPGLPTHIFQPPIYAAAVRNAELIKVAYNTFIGMKLAFVNTLLEICDKTGCNVDAVTDALKLATDRLISPMYLSAGMGDGGGCHPRDNIALSWLARELNLGLDFFGAVMQSREAQAEWLARTMIDSVYRIGLPLAIYGTAFKAGIDSELGSHALLVANLLREAHREVRLYDPHVAGREEAPPDVPMVILIGMNHAEVMAHKFAPGSVVIDPWRCIGDQEGVTVRKLGNG